MPFPILLLTLPLLTGGAKTSRMTATDMGQFSHLDDSLIQHLSRNNDSFVISPASFKTICGMIYEGCSSKSKSREELSKLLSLPSSYKEASAKLHSFQTSLQTKGKGVDWLFANRIIVNDLTLVEEFKARMVSAYNAQVVSTPFSPPQPVVKKTNDWVTHSTSGHIDTIIDPDQINDDLMVILLNAVFFKGSWKHSFSKQLTGNDCFYTEPNKCCQRLMMSQMGEFRSGYLKSIDANILELPYKDERFSMLITLPSKKNNLSTVTKKLVSADIISFIDKLTPDDIEIVIPKFVKEFSQDMKDVLVQMNVKEIFSREAQLSNMVSFPAFISAIYHKCKIQVNEEGTVAAGATAGLVTARSGVYSTKRFVANRPFLFFIRDKQSGIVFAGKIVDPGDDKK